MDIVWLCNRGKARPAVPEMQWPVRRSGMKRTYQYEVENDGERYDFDSNFMSDHETALGWLAEEAGENFYHKHDGWEASWPVVISLYYDETFLGCFSVDMENQPHFYSSLVEA
jgi:hypothetical protein